MGHRSRPQQDLLDLGGELSIPGHMLLEAQRVAALDVWLTQANATLAERALVQLAESQAVSNAARQYLNRLSDLMFVLARVLNRTGGGTEHQWDRNRNPKEAS
jgi:cob(I)alamin adenosyltransferase